MTRKGHGPRRKRMNRAARIQSAKQTRWVQAYTGKNVIRGYCKWYGVDALSAVIELRQLGVPIAGAKEAELREKAVRKSTASRVERVEDSSDSDATFAFIAGYTPSGFPYGVTWEELEDTNNEDEANTTLHATSQERRA